jgi:hypothetical protein
VLPSFAVGPKIYQPYRLPVRMTLWMAWMAVAIGVITIGSRSPEPNHPVGLLLLGLALAGSGLLAGLTLLLPGVWKSLVDPEFDAREARIHFYWLLGLCAPVGLVMVWSAVNRLL